MRRSALAPDSFRKSHNIRGSPAGAQTDYQVKIVVCYNSLKSSPNIGDFELANPIFAGAWRETGNVIYDPGDAGKEYKMYLGSTAGDIYYSYSTDRFTWSIPAIIINEVYAVEDPYVLKVGGTYYLYCENLVDGEPATKIDRYTSADGVTWGGQTTVLTKQGVGWEKDGVFSPTVWVEDGTWYMLYEGTSGTITRYAINVSIGQMGLATSADGLAWNRYAGNPVMSYGVLGDIDSDFVSPDDIYKEGSTYHLTYHGFDGIVVRTGFVTSTDLHTWVKDSGNPIIYPDLANPYTAIDTLMVFYDPVSEKYVYIANDSGFSVNMGYLSLYNNNVVGLNANCRTDFGDIRFKQGSTTLEYWMQVKVDGDYAIFWVKVPTIPAYPDEATIYIYYGRADEVTTESGADTWIEYEDWESYNIDDVLPLGIFEANSIQEVCKVSNNRAYKGTKSLFCDDDSAVNRNIIRWNYADKLAGGFRFLIAVYEEDYGGDWGFFLAQYNSVPAVCVTVDTGLVKGVNDYYAAAWHPIFPFTEDAWHIYEECIVIGADTWDAIYDEKWQLDRTKRDNIDALLYIDLYFSGAAAMFKGNLDICCIGKYADPEPTHESWGSEKHVVWPF